LKFPGCEIFKTLNTAACLFFDLITAAEICFRQISPSDFAVRSRRTLRFLNYGKIYKPVRQLNRQADLGGFQLFYFIFGIGFRNSQDLEFSHTRISFLR